MKGIEDLVSGFRRFQRRYFGEQRELYEGLARAGQAPRIMVSAAATRRSLPTAETLAEIHGCLKCAHRVTREPTDRQYADAGRCDDCNPRSRRCDAGNACPGLRSVARQ